MPDDVMEAIKRIIAVPMFRDNCTCEPPGHSHGCPGSVRIDDAYKFASSSDQRTVAAYLRENALTQSDEAAIRREAYNAGIADAAKVAGNFHMRGTCYDGAQDDIVDAIRNFAKQETDSE